MRPSPLERYRNKIRYGAPAECWPWVAACFDKGYGAFRLGGKQVKAHRFGYETAFGPIPDGMYVCHTCDNPPCQNPAHWFLGTHGENARDRERKNRGRRLSGEASTAAKLKEAQVREIRARFAAGRVRQSDLAQEFGVTQTVISMIVRRKTWRTLDDGLGDITSGSKYRHRLTSTDIDQIRADRTEGLTQEAIARKYGISQPRVSQLTKGS